MKLFSAFVIGLLFGVGLLVSGMTNPANIIGFLDITGAWNPSLALVMAGALLPASGAFYYVRRKRASLLGDTVSLPDDSVVTLRLIGGSALFGIGWGIAGYCPGPAVVSALSGIGPAIFCLAMVAGMILHQKITR